MAPAVLDCGPGGGVVAGGAGGAGAACSAVAGQPVSFPAPLRPAIAGLAPDFAGADAAAYMGLPQQSWPSQGAPQGFSAQQLPPQQQPRQQARPLDEEEIWIEPRPAAHRIGSVGVAGQGISGGAAPRGGAAQSGYSSGFAGGGGGAWVNPWLGPCPAAPPTAGRGVDGSVLQSPHALGGALGVAAVPDAAAGAWQPSSQVAPVPGAASPDAGLGGEWPPPPSSSQVISAEREADMKRLQEELGFSRMQVLEAFKRCSTAEAAVDWILSHEWNST